ncbi:cupin [Enterobacter sp.]|uniref:cupin n=1 Tax=Enterobacter sp. TaxID=42895 RepID=UPI00296EC264|nr:cupin [Enterobacter sp.]
MPEISYPNVEVLLLEAHDWVPNNPRLPVLLYRGVFTPGTQAIADVERLFADNGWPAQWVDGIFNYHHYHSEAHEVLAFTQGEAQVMLGGPGGTLVTVHAGDIALLPAGTGHCNKGSSDDFTVVGAYPPGQSADICRAAPSPEMLKSIATTPFPACDPVYGAKGPLLSHWLGSEREDAKQGG